MDALFRCVGILLEFLQAGVDERVHGDGFGIALAVYQHGYFHSGCKAQVVVGRVARILPGFFLQEVDGKVDVPEGCVGLFHLQQVHAPGDVEVGFFALVPDVLRHFQSFGAMIHAFGIVTIGVANSRH